MNKVLVAEKLAIPQQNVQLLDCTLLPDENSIQKHKQKIKLEPKVFQVLFYLAQQQGLVVSRQTLLEQVWPNRVLTDDAINRCIFQIRKCLKQLNTEVQIITHAKSGYQLLLHPTSSAKNKQLSSKRYYWALLGLMFCVFASGLWWSWEPAIHYQKLSLLMSDKMERYPQVSPDNDLLVFSRQTEQGMAIVLKQLSNHAERQMTSGQYYDHQPDFSPDQQQLAFARILPDQTCTLILMDILDKRQTQIGRCQPAGVYDLQWHPDGNSLVYIDRQHALSAPRLNHLQLDSGQQQDISPDIGQGVDDFYLSRDGRLFLSVQMSLGIEQIYQAHIDKPERVTLVKALKAKVHGLAWHPIQQRLYFTSDYQGPFQLWSVQENGADLQQLAIAGTGGDELSIDDSGNIYLEQWQQQSEIMALSLKDGSVHTVTPAKANNWHLYPVTPSETLFISDRSGHAEIWLEQGEKLQQLTQEQGHWLLSFDYYPPQKKLIYSYPYANSYQTSLLQVRPEVEKQQTINNAFSAIWSKDGNNLYFTRQSLQQQWQIWHMDLVSGIEQQLPIELEAKVIKWDQRQQGLYFTHPNQPGLWHLSLDKTEAKLITSELQIVDQFNWSPFAEGVYYINRSSQGAELKKYSNQTQQTTTVTTLGNLLYFSGLQLNQAQTELYYSQISHQDADILQLKKMPN